LISLLLALGLILSENDGRHGKIKFVGVVAVACKSIR
jgi:hypothetical protein